VQALVDALSQRPADAGHLTDLVDARRDQSLQSAEMRQQLLPTLGPDASMPSRIEVRRARPRDSDVP
jgi:hypothetical protein